MDVIDGKYFDLVLESAETLCKLKYYENGLATFNVPSNEIQMSHALMRIERESNG